MMDNGLTDDKSDHIDYNLIPLRALNVSCRRQLSIALLPERTLPTSTGITRDWQGLCELAGFSYDMIQLFKNRSNPVVDMLEYWSGQQPSVAELVSFLELMERFDIIEDIQPLLEKDSLAYLRSREQINRNNERDEPLQDSRITSGAATTTFVVPITVDDVENIHSGCANPEKYDAYVSYMDSDLDFVQELVRELEGNFKLRLFIKERDMLPGVVESEADLCMINERCEKILLIVSQHSLVDPHCEFQAVVAQASAVDSNLYSKKVIPIICKPCVLPSRFKYLARLDYTKQHLFGGFWKRLFYSIKSSIPDSYVPSTTTRYSLPYYSPLTTEMSTVNNTSTSALSHVSTYTSAADSSLTVNTPVRDRTMSVPDLRITVSPTSSDDTQLNPGPVIARSVTPTPESSSKSSSVAALPFITSAFTVKTPKTKKKSPPSTKKKLFRTTGFFSRGTSA